MQNWTVYIIRCSDNSFYTGITTDVARRFKQHQSGKGAKYFRKCLPEAIVFTETSTNRSKASQREAEIKALSRNEKMLLVAQKNQS